MKPPLPARQARSASSAWNVTKTFVQMVVFWSVFLFVFPPLIGRVEESLGLALPWARPGAWRAVAVVIFAAAGALGLWSAWIMATEGKGTPLPFDCPRRLVVRGPYRVVRNPMAIAGLSQAAAVGMFLHSWAVLAYVLAGFVVWNYLVRRWEEDDLSQRFGAPYEQYRRHVRCWFPRLTPYRGSDEPPMK